jgi:hypothetical protein
MKRRLRYGTPICHSSTSAPGTHPRTVFNHSPLGKAARDEKKAITEPRKRKGGQANEIDDATRRAHEMLDYHEQRRGPDLAEFLDLSPEHIEASVDNLIDIFGEAAVRRLFAVLQRWQWLKPMTLRPMPTIAPGVP